MIIGKSLPRRTFLRGMGASIALPFLDAMRPAMAADSAVRGATPVRMAFTYVPNGIIMKDWTPSAEGALTEFPRVLAPLKEFRDDILLMSGLTQNGGRALGDGPGDHARAAASYLTGAHPKKTSGADIFNGVSVDQVAANKVGGGTRFASVELGMEDGRMAGNCDSGYSCAYSNSISWRTATTPNPPEINPKLVFERLFAGMDPTETAASRAKREIYKKSILDFVREDTESLKPALGATDKRKLDEYLFAVRDLEKRIEQADKNKNNFEVAIEKPSGVPLEFNDHARLMFDLQAVALQAGLTRVVTFMMGREGSNRTYREIGISEAHHGMTHHRNDPELIEKIAQINKYHMEQFAYFIGKLKSIKDGDGTLLDHTMVVYGSGISDGNRHTHNDLPVLLAGRGAKNFKLGRHVRYPVDTPLANFYLAMLDRMGVETEKLGDSNGQLQHLTDI